MHYGVAIYAHAFSVNIHRSSHRSAISATSRVTVWKWLFDQKHEVSGLVYEENSKVIALAHYRKMPSPLRGKYIGFLDDLFVDPEHRGKKIGEKILSELKDLSEKYNCGLIKWITRNDNIRAKSLYDKVSEKTTWDTYEFK